MSRSNRRGAAASAAPLTLRDLRRPSNRSGYRHVSADGGIKPYYAYSGRNRTGDWQGPRRAYAIEAARDYLAWARGEGVTAARKLRSTDRKSAPRQRLPRTPEVEAALGVIRDARGQQDGNQGYIYLIRDGRPMLHDRPYFVKVGYSTKPEARVAELQAGNPNTLYLIATIKGTVEDEAALHQKYIKQNVQGEWFVISDELLAEFTDVAEAWDDHEVHVQLHTAFARVVREEVEATDRDWEERGKAEFARQAYGNPDQDGTYPNRALPAGYLKLVAD